MEIPTSEMLRMSVRSIQERSEQYDIDYAEFFVDTNILDTLRVEKNQVLFGRRGLGKTHILGRLNEYYRDRFQEERILPILINCQPIAHKASIYESDERNYSLVAYKEFLTSIITSMELFMMNNVTKSIFEKVWPGKNTEKIVRVTNILSEIQTYIQRGERALGIGEFDSKFIEEYEKNKNRGIGIDLDLNPLSQNLTDQKIGITGKFANDSKSKVAETMNTIYKGLIVYDLNKIGKNLDSIITELNLKSTIILLDEWSKIQPEYQAFLAEMIKTTIITGRSIFVKFGCIPTETYLSKVKTNRQTIGFPINEEVFVGIDLDQLYTSFMEPSPSITDFLLKVLQKHLSVNIPTFRNEDFSEMKEYFKKYIFKNDLAIRDLVILTSGIPRDFLHVFVKAFIKSENELPIPVENVREAALEFFNKGKSDLIANHNKKASELFENIYESLPTYIFLVSRKYSKNWLLQEIWHNRLIHLILEGTTAYANGKLGTFDVYKIDQGRYITLRSFDKGEEEYGKMDKRFLEIKQKLKIEDHLKKIWPPSVDRVFKSVVISTLSKGIARTSDSSSVNLRATLENCDDQVVDKLIMDASNGN